MLAQRQWVKSSKSGPNCDNCVEAFSEPGVAVDVRDTKDRTGPQLRFAPADWQAFVNATAGRGRQLAVA